LGALGWRFLLNDENRITDLDLGVGNGAVGVGDAHALGRAENRGIELEGLVATVNNQAWRDAAV
jgi:hypothetical protein